MYFSPIIILVTMIFLHVVADYSLQGILASMKQSDWWEKQFPGYRESIYRWDPIAALFTHAFEWSFIVMLPMLLCLYDNGVKTDAWTYLILLAVNTAIHGFVDNLKVNKKSISLIHDQALHLVQIFATFIVWTLLIGW